MPASRPLISKSYNNIKASSKIILPMLPHELCHDGMGHGKTQAGNIESEMDIYVRFMRHLRLVPNSRMEIKVLSAIQFTADMLDVGDDLIAKTLVDLGLRAPRKAFPMTYLEFVDKSFLRKRWDLGAPNKSLIALQKHWGSIGEDKFAAFQYDLKLPCETLYVEA